MPQSIYVRREEENKKRKSGTYQFRLRADGNILNVIVRVWMHPD